MPAKQRRPTQAQIITIIAGALAIDASVGATAATLAPLIGVSEAALHTALAIAMSRPIRYGVTVLPTATASAASQAQEAHFRALYVYNATNRLEAGGDPKDEQRFFNQHMDAVSKRRDAASSVDRMRARYGDELGWYAKMDSRTSPECREANGKNFSVTQVPDIGFPGAVHPYCRCKAGRKHATSQTVYGIRMKVA